MALPTDAIGKTYPPTVYAVGREKVREYASAVGETNPLHTDVERAREAGYRDVVAPPMFCVVYAGPAVGRALFDPDLAIDFSRVLHGGQEFTWGPLVVAGDEISTVVEVTEVRSRADLQFFTFGTVSRNQDGATVCSGTWTNIVRGG